MHVTDHVLNMICASETQRRRMWILLVWVTANYVKVYRGASVHLQEERGHWAGGSWLARGLRRSSSGACNHVFASCADVTIRREHLSSVATAKGFEGAAEPHSKALPSETSVPRHHNRARQVDGTGVHSTTGHWLPPSSATVTRGCSAHKQTRARQAQGKATSNSPLPHERASAERNTYHIHTSLHSPRLRRTPPASPWSTPQAGPSATTRSRTV